MGVIEAKKCSWAGEVDIPCSTGPFMHRVQFMMGERETTAILCSNHVAYVRRRAAAGGIPMDSHGILGSLWGCLSWGDVLGGLTLFILTTLLVLGISWLADALFRLLSYGLPYTDVTRYAT